MRRRALMLILAGTSAASRPLRAEGAAPLIGFLGLASAEFSATPLAAFHEGLRDQGFIEGKNVSIEYRWAGGNPDRLPAFAAELVRLGPAVIVTSGGRRQRRQLTPRPKRSRLSPHLQAALSKISPAPAAT